VGVVIRVAHGCLSDRKRFFEDTAANKLQVRKSLKFAILALKKLIPKRSQAVAMSRLRSSGGNSESLILKINYT
jgi:hypothetical protein